jgi:hypothetical protein
MGILDLKKLWEICNKLSYEQTILEEKDVFVSLLGNSSSYYSNSFEWFLEYYSFKIEEDCVVVFNDQKIPYEDYSNQDFSYVPICILGFGEQELENYIKQSVAMQLEKQEKEKIAAKENIRLQIERLTKQYNNL